MYYLIINKSDLVTTEGIDLTPDTARQSVDGFKIIIDDTAFSELGVKHIPCELVDWETGIELMETPDWKVEE